MTQSSNIVRPKVPEPYATPIDGVAALELSEISPLRYAAEYLASCYPEDGPYHDSQLIVEFIAKHQADIGHQSCLLDIGSAAVISYATCLSRNIDRVQMSDIYPEHLLLIQDWLNHSPGAHNWKKHIEFVLQAEQQEISPWSIKKREDEFRRKLPIESLVLGDLTQHSPLSSSTTFPVVSCFYATEQAATAHIEDPDGVKNKWFTIMDNLSSLVAPGGHLILSAVHNSDFYITNDRDRRPTKIKIARISSQDIELALSQNQFDIETADIKVVQPLGLEDEGISEILLVYARKHG